MEFISLVRLISHLMLIHTERTQSVDCSLLEGIQLRAPGSKTALEDAEKLAKIRWLFWSVKVHCNEVNIHRVRSVLYWIQYNSRISYIVCNTHIENKVRIELIGCFDCLSILSVTSPVRSSVSADAFHSYSSFIQSTDQCIIYTVYHIQFRAQFTLVNAKR